MHVENAGGTFDDRAQFVVVVVVEPGDEAETVAKRTGDHAGSGGGADEGERRHRQADTRCCRPLADHDVELEVLHRRIQDLLDRSRQSVDLVDEQHVAVLEFGEDRRQIAGAFQRRTRRDVQVDAHLGGHDAGQRGLAEAGRAGEQQVIDRLLTLAGRLEDDAQVLLEFALADELVERTRPQAGLELDLGCDDVVVAATDTGIEELVTHDAPPTT